MILLSKLSLNLYYSVEVVTSLLNHMFKDVSKDSAIVNGVLVLLELLMFKKQGYVIIHFFLLKTCESVILLHAFELIGYLHAFNN